ncbi:MAG: RcnB family protein [Novosphingobium sp.]|nr:RcnB family protein [Novosphingobium sp.]
MKKVLNGAVAALTAIGSVMTAVPAAAQYSYRDSRDYGYSNQYRTYDRDRDRDRDHDRYRDRYDRRTNERWHYYGDRYGYDGYRGRWRTGQRFPYYSDRRYVITDYNAYGLPPPRPGYRYYRDSSGDIVMAAVASGIIGLIVGSALSDNHRSYHRRW